MSDLSIFPFFFFDGVDFFSSLTCLSSLTLAGLSARYANKPS